MAILDLCKLPELLIVAAWAVKLNVSQDLMSTNQPKHSFICSLLNTDCQMDKFLNVSTCDILWVH